MKRLPVILAVFALATALFAAPVFVDRGQTVSVDPSRGADPKVDYGSLVQFGPWDDRNYALTASDLTLLVPNENELRDPIPAFFRVTLRKARPDARRSGPVQYPRSALNAFRIDHGGYLVNGVLYPNVTSSGGRFFVDLSDTIVHWLNGIRAKGEVRAQFHHGIDIASTILDVAGLPEPTFVHGVQQKPFEGVSMKYSFEDANAAERHETQYFEMFVNRGIYHKGWTAVTRHSTPWIKEPLPPFDDDVWELYDTNTDWSQSHDLSKEMPERLHELQRLFLIEATKYNVLPLDDRRIERFNPDLAGRPVLIRGRSQLLFSGMGRLSEKSVLNIKNKSHSITAEIILPGSGANGVIIAEPGVNPYVYDWDRTAKSARRKSVADAVKILAEAGYPGGRNKDGKPLVIYFDNASTGPEAVPYLNWLRKKMRLLGIELEIRTTDYNRFQEKIAAGNSQMFGWGWNADYPDPENFLFLLYGPDGKVNNDGENAVNYDNPEYNRLFRQMENMSDTPERLDIIRQMVAILQKDAPTIRACTTRPSVDRPVSEIHGRTTRAHSI